MQCLGGVGFALLQISRSVHESNLQAVLQAALSSRL